MTRPILLFNDECSVCRWIARWVGRSALKGSGEMSIVEQPIGDDPEALRALNPALDIWDAYATIHLLMPDGSMKVGGEAVAEVLRHLHNTRWFAGIFGVSVFGFRPFQTVVNAAYAVLAGIRPVLGCESCGTPNLWMRPLVWSIKHAKATLGGRHPRRGSSPPFPSHATARRPPSAAVGIGPPGQPA